MFYHYFPFVPHCAFTNGVLKTILTY